MLSLLSLKTWITGLTILMVGYLLTQLFICVGLCFLSECYSCDYYEMILDVIARSGKVHMHHPNLTLRKS